MNETELVERYRPAVEAAARRWARSSGGAHDVDDLAQEGFIALLRARRRTPDLEPSLTLLAIDRGMQDYMRSRDKVRRGVIQPRPRPVGLYARVLDGEVEPDLDAVDDRALLEDFIEWAGRGPTGWSGLTQKRLAAILDFPTQTAAVDALGLTRPYVSKLLARAARKAVRYRAVCFR